MEFKLKFSIRNLLNSIDMCCENSNSKLLYTCGSMCNPRVHRYIRVSAFVPLFVFCTKKSSMDQEISVTIATHYGLDGPATKSQWG
jgi:hypothetical protein